MVNVKHAKDDLLTVLVAPSPVGTAERVHGEKGDVCRRGLHESGQRTAWRAALSLPGCRSGGQHGPDHLPGPFGTNTDTNASLQRIFFRTSLTSHKHSHLLILDTSQPLWGGGGDDAGANAALCRAEG